MRKLLQQLYSLSIHLLEKNFLENSPAYLRSAESIHERWGGPESPSSDSIAPVESFGDALRSLVLSQKIVHK